MHPEHRNGRFLVTVATLCAHSLVGNFGIHLTQLLWMKIYKSSVLFMIPDTRLKNACDIVAPVLRTENESYTDVCTSYCLRYEVWRCLYDNHLPYTVLPYIWYEMFDFKYNSKTSHVLSQVRTTCGTCKSCGGTSQAIESLVLYCRNKWRRDLCDKREICSMSIL